MAIECQRRVPFYWDERTFATDAQCSIAFAVDEVVEIAHAIPLRWGPPELSPANPMLG
ncbi:NTP pyrophosphatase (non-canonical NTP hydrolase) [Nocardia sp. GAS34]|uniref:hypothetical protein n=1 Tax=unclassified Nocardia TaxID=2637762 RepID=UPI003D1BFB04